MRLLKKVLRPIYRRFFKKPLWSFLSKVKVFLMADLVAEIESKMAGIEASNTAQWKALEQLLLAVIRLPEQPVDVVTLSDAPPVARVLRRPEDESRTRGSRSKGPEGLASKRDGVRSDE